LLAAAPARAQPTTQSTEYSPYEKESIKSALETLHIEADPSPEGKTIERIDIVRLDVVENRDVDWMGKTLGPFTKDTANWFHYTTRESIIRREMLLNEGDRWEQVTIEEIARNMRSRMPLQVSIVLIVPVKGSAPDKVGVLVITKDIWSLRLSYNLSVVPGGVEDFLLVPQETNLLGLQHTASARFRYQPESYTLGVGYSIPRFGKTWIGASAGANVFLSRQGDIEGSAMTVSVGQGLYSTRTEWAWSVGAGYSVGVARLYSNAHLAVFDPTPTNNPADDIPVRYRSGSVTASAGVTRSFGWALKNNFGLTMNLARSSVREIDLGSYSDAERAAFRARYFPVGEDRVYPALAWTTFRNDYLRTLDINTFALQEDYRLGHTVSAEFYPVSKALGSTRDLVGVSASAGYSLPMGDGLVGANVGTFAEQDLEQKTVTDGSVSGGFGAVTPRLGFGRLVMNTSFVNRYKNYLNSQTTTGGNGRLRGYPTSFFLGKDAYFYNVEFRTTSVRLLFAQIGAVAFYDAGDATTGFTNLSPKQSLGAGLRILFPQLNRLVLRADIAFPLKRGPFPNTATCAAPDTGTAILQGCKPIDPFGFNITIDQAFAP
jgi:hypothetical protein